MLKLTKISGRGSGTRGWVVRGLLRSPGLLLFVVVLAGCPKRPEVGQQASMGMGPPGMTQPASPQPPGQPSPPAEPVKLQPSVATEPVKLSRPQESPLKDIFFDFDRSDIREDQKAALAANVAWLKANPAVRASIEGHCDERGTAEYNLALGERRAKVARDFLLAAGIDAARLSTISYGKERPFVLGHDESAWKFNRRAHIVPE